MVPGTHPWAAGSLSPGPAESQPLGRVPWVPLLRGVRVPLLTLRAAHLLLIQTFGYRQQIRGALGSKLGVLILECFPWRIGPARSNEAVPLGSKPAQGHVLLHTFCVPAHIHSASPQKATLGCSWLCSSVSVNRRAIFSRPPLQPGPAQLCSCCCLRRRDVRSPRPQCRAHLLPLLPFPWCHFFIMTLYQPQWGLTTPV